MEEHAQTTLPVRKWFISRIIRFNIVNILTFGIFVLVVNLVDPSPAITWYFRFLWIFLLCTNVLYTLAIIIVPLLIRDDEPNEERVSNSYFLITVVGLAVLGYVFIGDIIRLLN